MEYLYQFISKITGLPIDPLWQEKLPFILWGLISLVFGISIFVYWFHKKFWSYPECRKLFWGTCIIFAVIIMGKFGVYFFAKGYIPDRIFMYALPSPRIRSIFWLLIPVGIFIIFFRYRERILTLRRHQFLSVLMLMFVLFSLSVAGIRDGMKSITDPFDRTYWEYTGNLPLVDTAKNFLEDYIFIQDKLALHSITHPPGNTLFLYGLQKIVGVNHLSLTIAFVVVLSGMIPLLYYFWGYFFSEQERRKAIMLYAVTPSIILFSATALDAFFMLLVWLTIITTYVGWRKNIWFALVAGVVAAGALLSNYLFLLLAPFFLWWGWTAYHDTEPPKRVYVLTKILGSLGVFAVFFFMLDKWSGYSIIDNFFIAKQANHGAVPSNYASLGAYLIFLIISATDFLIYVGVPYLYFIYSQRKKEYKAHWLGKVGMVLFAFLLCLGVFQAETGRLWLFLVPWCIPLMIRVWSSERSKEFDALLILLCFQTIAMQVIFYTYW